MPTRYLKPGVCDSEAMERIKSPAAEVMYYRLLTVVDDFGRTDARPLVLKAKCFPIKVTANEKNISAWLSDLCQSGVILLYEVENKPFLQITKWDNKPRALKSLFPAPADSCIQTSASAQRLHTVLPVTETVTETVTDISAEPSLDAGSPAEVVCYIPLVNKTEFAVPRELAIELETAYPAVDVPATLKEIRAWCLTNPTRCKTASGVRRFLNSWLSREQNRG